MASGGCGAVLPLWYVCFLVLGLAQFGAGQRIPTTLDGPFTPRTVEFDSSLRRGSVDLLPTDPRVAKTVVGDAPEQIALALSTPDAMWVSWVTGNCPLFSIAAMFLRGACDLECCCHGANWSRRVLMVTL